MQYLRVWIILCEITFCINNWMEIRLNVRVSVCVKGFCIRNGCVLARRCCIRVDEYLYSLWGHYTSHCSVILCANKCECQCGCYFLYTRMYNEGDGGGGRMEKLNKKKWKRRGTTGKRNWYQETRKESRKKIAKRNKRSNSLTEKRKEIKKQKTTRGDKI